MDIYTLLEINNDFLQTFHLQAKDVVNRQTELALERNRRILNDIKERMMTDRRIEVPVQIIDRIIKKVITNATQNNQDMNIWSIRELRIVSYYLIKLQDNENAYRYAISLLNNKWRNMFFNGLSFYCLDNWNRIAPNLRDLTCKLLTDKLQQYNGNNAKYLAMKNHADLYNRAGPLRLSRLLLHNNQDVSEAPSYFCNKPSTISQSYYSDVIINFFESKNTMDLKYVKSVLDCHMINRTKKLVIADLVQRFDNHGNDMDRSQLCWFAKNLLGDITLASNWYFSGATEQDTQKLDRARQLINRWLNKKIIEIFFEVCVQDRNRKKFWLNYVDYISSFKVVGSTTIRGLLQQDGRVREIFSHSYFIETRSHVSRTSALILFIRNKMIVEFSDTGALYVYKLEHEKVSLVRRRNVQSIEDLKVPNMNALITRYFDYYYHYQYEEEGRMTHQGDWQDRLTRWMRNMMV